MSIRVLVVDDSSVVRQTMQRIFEPEPDIEVVGTAPDPYVARDKILELKPDVVLLDVEMPRMDGLTFLKKIMKHRPLPVVICSSITPKAGRLAMEALSAGAIDVLCKPSSAFSLGTLGAEIIQSVRSAAGSKPQTIHRPQGPQGIGSASSPIKVQSKRRIIGIGASTGGTETTRRLLQSFPADAPSVLIVQHITDAFAPAYANHLNEVTGMEIRLAKDGDPVTRGVGLLAPGDQHMSLEKDANGSLYVKVRKGPKVQYQRPSVDVLFNSIAKIAGREAVGVLLTGMGKDGAEGLLAMRQAGARTIAQDEATSIVYGMPRVAAELGAADQVMPLDKIAAAALTAPV